MHYYQCDICHRTLKPSELRYHIKIEVTAIYEQNEIHLADLIRNHMDEITKLIQKMEQCTADELEEQIYKQFNFDLCPKCQKLYLSQPLPTKCSNINTDEPLSIPVEHLLRWINSPEEPQP